MTYLEPVDVAFPSTVPRVETERLTLRSLTPTDSAAIFALFSDQRVTRSTDIAPFEQIEQAERLIASLAARFEEQTGMRWGITLKGEDTVIGTAGFPGVYGESRRAEIGYDLAHAYWGKGLTTEAVRALVKLGFERLDLNRIEATTNLDNVASMRVLAKAGFREEGILREYGFWRGAFHDLRIFSLLRREYRG